MSNETVYSVSVQGVDGCDFHAHQDSILDASSIIISYSDGVKSL